MWPIGGGSPFPPRVAAAGTNDRMAPARHPLVIRLENPRPDLLRVLRILQAPSLAVLALSCHCLSMTFHCLSLTVHCRFTALQAPADRCSGAVLRPGPRHRRGGRDCHSAAPPCTFTRCFNRDKQGCRQNDSLLNGKGGRAVAGGRPPAARRPAGTVGARPSVRALLAALKRCHAGGVDRVASSL